MNFKLSNEIYEELISNKYPTLFEIEIGGKEKIKVVRYEEYKKLENIIKEIREYIKNIPDDEFVESEHFTELLEMLDKRSDEISK